MLIVTGIGLSAALPIVQQMMCSEREVFLIWITRSKEQICFMVPLLLNATSTMIFYDGNENMDDVKADLSCHRHIRVYVGRPQINKIIEWLVVKKHAKLYEKLKTKHEQDKSTKDDSNFRRAIRRSKEEIQRVVGWRTAAQVAVFTSRIGLTLPQDAAVFSECDAKLLMDHLPAKDRSTWALLYCGNVPPVKKVVHSSSKAWGFMYSEESFAW